MIHHPKEAVEGMTAAQKVQHYHHSILRSQAKLQRRTNSPRTRLYLTRSIFMAQQHIASLQSTQKETTQ